MISDRPSPPQIFDRLSFRKGRAKAASTFGDFSFLFDQIIEDVVDRLEVTNRHFENALFYGTRSATNSLSTNLTERCGVGNIIEADLTTARVFPSPNHKLVFDEEKTPFTSQIFDLSISVLTLHATNDLIGALTQIRHSLKPDGLMIAVLFGEDTLRRFKDLFIAVEAAQSDALHARFSPMATAQDLGMALQRAGFALPVVDVDRIDVKYRQPENLLKDLRGMGEKNYLTKRSHFVSRKILGDTLNKFHAGGGGVNFDIVTLTGWAPAPTQPKPLKPGSATHSLSGAIKGAI